MIAPALHEEIHEGFTEYGWEREGSDVGWSAPPEIAGLLQ